MKSGPDESGLNCHVRQGSCLWQASPPISDDEDDFDPTAPYEFVEGTFERKRKGAPQNMKFGRYPFMPSMLAGGECLPNSAPRDWASSVLEHPVNPVFVCQFFAGLGGPAKDCLPPKEHAIGHPEWFQNHPANAHVFAWKFPMDEGQTLAMCKLLFRWLVPFLFGYRVVICCNVCAQGQLYS